MSEKTFQIHGEITLKGTRIPLVDQDAWMTVSVANWLCVLETGRVVPKGTARELRDNLN